MTTDYEPTAPLFFNAKVGRYLFVLLLWGVAVYLFLPRIAAMKHALLVILSLRIPFVALSVGMQLLSYLGSGYLLRAVVEPATKQISVIDGALITAGANSVGTLGGGVLGTAGMTYLWLGRRGVSAGSAGLGGWLPIFLNNIVLAIMSLAGLMVVVRLGKTSGVLLVGFALIFFTLGASLTLLIVSLRYRDKLVPIAIAIAGFIGRLRRKPPARDKIEAGVGQLLEGWDALVQGGWRGPTLGAILNTGFDMLSLGFLFWATGYRINVPVLVAGYGIPQLLGKFTIVLGGVGVVEAGMVALYALLGAPKESAVVAVLAYRLLSFWVPTLVGVALVPYLGRWAGTSGGPSGT